MINLKNLENKKPSSASMEINNRKEIEQLYITAKSDLEEKNYANQFKKAMEIKFAKNQINSHTRFTYNRSHLPLHYSITQATDSYTRKKDGMVPLTVKQKFI